MRESAGNFKKEMYVDSITIMNMDKESELNDGDSCRLNLNGDLLLRSADASSPVKKCVAPKPFANVRFDAKVL